jgi:hypothetical protein
MDVKLFSDPKGMRMFGNRKLRRIFGHTREEVKKG